MTSKAFGLAQLGNAYADGALSNRNKIINGAMTIDQRNAGAAYTPSGVAYALDRWNTFMPTGSGHSIQKVSDAPAGFVSSQKVTIGTGAAPAAANQNAIWQPIEGNNIYDLGFGTASAKPITVSFVVKSSVTGTFNIAIVNGTGTRSYVSTYTINSADTWEYKSVSIEGDTTGTWATDNGVGLTLWFSLGFGSDFETTPNSWASGDFKASSSGVDLVATSGATWQITGVQLEAGDTATPFEHRSYGAELALCQRYFEKSYNTATAPATATYVGILANGGFYAGPSASYGIRVGAQYKATKRATPTVTTFDSSGNAGKCNFPDASTNVTMTVIHNGENGFTAETTAVSTNQTRVYWHYTSSAEL